MSGKRGEMRGERVALTSRANSAKLRRVDEGKPRTN